MSNAPWTEAEMLTLAARGVGKVDAYGSRGATLVSRDEIEAMALTLALFGLRPLPPGEAAPRPVDRPLQPLKGPADV